ncbi:MAG: lysophospholipid acyltransferase family protein, partial [Planctomycetota bacterium]
KWVLKSWDRYYIPKPFARVVLVIGAPIRVTPGAKREALEAARTALETALNRVSEIADRHFPRRT